MNGEKLTKIDIISIISAMIGVIIITNPQLIDSDASQESFDKLIEQYPYFYVGIIGSLSYSFFSGMAYVYIRRIGKDVHISLGPMYFGFFSALLAITSMSIMKVPMNSHLNLESVGIMTVLCICGASA